MPVSTPTPTGRFGDYRLIRRISVGGMAEVFEAEGPLPQTQDGAAPRRVAIKRLLPSAEEDPQLVQMFRIEARLVRLLSHRRVAALLDVGQAGGVDFIAYEFIDGLDLATVRRRLVAGERWVTAEEGAALGLQAAEGLAYIHAAADGRGQPLRIVHRDLSPHNLMLERGGALKIIDFGIAKYRDSEQTQGGIRKGKRAYMSPEQVRREPLDGRSDLFSLGTLLYELMAGRRLFAGNTFLETLERVERAEVPPLAQARPDLPEALTAAIHRCLGRAPRDRYARADELVAALAPLLGDRAPEAPLRDLVRDLAACEGDGAGRGVTLEAYRRSLHCAEDDGVETTDMRDDPEATAVFSR